MTLIDIELLISNVPFVHVNHFIYGSMASPAFVTNENMSISGADLTKCSCLFRFLSFLFPKRVQLIVMQILITNFISGNIHIDNKDMHDTFEN